jgi:hypothetical protein
MKYVVFLIDSLNTQVILICLFLHIVLQFHHFSFLKMIHIWQVEVLAPFPKLGLLAELVLNNLLFGGRRTNNQTQSSECRCRNYNNKHQVRLLVRFRQKAETVQKTMLEIDNKKVKIVLLIFVVVQNWP